jgi:peptidoglycan/xylan/chitin deacetylase (PgdA/CDA1 family)
MIRLDRAMTMMLRGLSRGNRPNATAILAYHSVSDQPDKHAHHHPYFRTITSPTRFASQMQWLKDEGAEVIALSDWNKSSGSALRVVLTFDDGFADFYTDAVPVLNKFGYTATEFLPTRFIGSGEQLEHGFEHLSWDRINALIKEGFEFGSHTSSHLFLGDLASRQIHQEVAGSQLEIRQKTGTAPLSFACPYAFPEAHPKAVAALLAALRLNKFATAVTTRIGTVQPHDDPFLLKRIPINECDDHDLFLAKICGYYDWLSFAQHSFKMLKRVVRPGRPSTLT